MQSQYSAVPIWLHTDIFEAARLRLQNQWKHKNSPNPLRKDSKKPKRTLRDRLHPVLRQSPHDYQSRRNGSLVRRGSWARGPKSLWASGGIWWKKVQAAHQLQVSGQWDGVGPWKSDAVAGAARPAVVYLEEGGGWWGADFWASY